MRSLLAVLVLLAGCASAPPPAPEAPAPAELPYPTALLAPDAKPKTAVSLVFTEGPAANADGHVFYTEITGNRILEYAPDGSIREFRNPSGRANGLAFDAEGRLLACEGGGEGGNRRVTRTDMKTGKVEVLASDYEGKKLNSPNDIVAAANGRIYFTDPRYGAQDGRELETEDVYMIDTDGSLTRVATKPEIAKPNGIALSPDQKTLYVADTQPGTPTEARVMAFDVAEDGSLSNGRSIYSFGGGRGIDGMAIDVDGNLYGAAGDNGNLPENPAGVYVITPEGKLAGVIPVSEDPITNCTFGGPDLKTLYVTSGKTLYTIQTKTSGFLVYPKP
ncbi:MAG: SMP-30/gluconolactonase/LRE family protein [Bryobacterales bacterium]|nr:SMP-30/gluconolactonase/LRE family protein [Bryobacterales bacterium]